jgi:hypothetical protein
LGAEDGEGGIDACGGQVAGDGCSESGHRLRSP